MIRLVIAVVAGLLVLPDIARADRIVTPTADVNDGTCDAHCTLREAVALATGGDDRPRGDDLHADAGRTDLDGNFTIDGDGARGRRRSGATATTVSRTSPTPASSTLTDLTVANGHADSESSPPGAPAAPRVGPPAATPALRRHADQQRSGVPRRRDRRLRGPQLLSSRHVRRQLAPARHRDHGTGGRIYLAEPGGNAVLLNSTLSDNRPRVCGGSRSAARSARRTIRHRHVTIANNRAATGAAASSTTATRALECTTRSWPTTPAATAPASPEICSTRTTTSPTTRRASSTKPGDLQVTDARSATSRTTAARPTRMRCSTEARRSVPRRRPDSVPQTDQRGLSRGRSRARARSARSRACCVRLHRHGEHDNGNGVCSDNPARLHAARRAHRGGRGRPGDSSTRRSYDVSTGSR